MGGTVGRFAPGRDPAAVVELGVQVVLGVLLTLTLPVELDNAAAVVVLALGGVLTALWVAKEKLLAALVGFIKAAGALVLTLGMHLDPSVETGIIMLVSAAVAFWLRGQVVAPITVDGVVLSSRPAS